MTVALVNEDQGAKFNGKQYEFGDEFVRNVEKDDQHDWYVVSRGVAESGLKRNVYNMMIVIPNDFTQKALSIDSRSPEKVVLNYKINASDNSNMKAKAEKTASAILGDFNRRIIDVYFASVLGNLHDAQDNIGTLVKKENLYTNVYNDSIHRPLAGYTSQFDQVQDDTKLSKDRFKGVEDLLKGFKGSLGEGQETNRTFQTSFMDYAKMLDANTLTSKGFSDQLSDLDSQMNNEDVLQQLDALLSANQTINDQFHSNNDLSTNILSESDALQVHLSSIKEKTEAADTELADKLASDMQALIGEKLKSEIKNASGQEQNVSLNQFFAMPDKNARGTIQKQIDQLPSLTPEDLDGLGLDPTTVIQLKNVIEVTNQYNREFEYSPNRNPDRIPLSDLVKQINNSLITNDVTLVDSVTLPKNHKSGGEFTLSIPEEFTVKQLLLTLPNQEEKDYTGSFHDNKKIILPDTGEGTFTVKVKVNLKESANINVFQPVTWNWEMDQQDVTKVDQPDPVPPETPEEPVGEPPTDPVTAETNGTQTGMSGTSNETITNQTEETSNPSGNDGTNSDLNSPSTGDQEKESQTDPNTGEPSNNDPKVDQEKPVEKIIITNNHLSHQIMSPLTDPSSALMNAANDTIRHYQKILSLYQLYFGIGMEQFNQPDFANQLAQTNLKEMATTDSLYYLFNKQDIVDVLANFTAEQITEEIRQETEDLKNKMDEYLQLVQDADQNSTQMAELIQQTMEQVEILNANLGKTLEDLAAWREASLALKVKQSEILSNGIKEQSAVLSLGSDFGSLLESSQSLADESKNHLTAANHVYQTFDALDQQVRDIQASGKNLVKQAGDLSNNLTNKVLQDEKFADNFAGVLANSRVGQRPNENLLSFLSNPVQTENAGIIPTSDAFTPYFLVLICFIVALFTAYVISTNERKRLENDSFAEERSLAANNLPITLITASIGLVEGLVIGLISSSLLNIGEEKFMLWISTITLIMAAMLLVAAYLLRQLKMVGMFILLAIFSLYLFLTEALGLHFDQLSFAARLREYSPLQYIEKLFMQFGSGTADNQSIIAGLFALIIVSLVGHLFVVHRIAGSEEVNHEGVSESL